MSESRQFQRRSFVARKLEGSEFLNINDGAVMVKALANASDNQVQQSGLIDLSVAQRFGFEA